MSYAYRWVGLLWCRTCALVCTPAMSHGKHPFTIRLELLLRVPVTETLVCSSLRTKISTLRARIEHEFGILPEMYFLTYLDADPLDQDSTLQDHFVVNGATLTLRPWKIWRELLEHAFHGNVDQAMKTMNITGPSEWNKHCAWCALYIAAHHGYELMVDLLLKRTSAPINAQSPSGWTALHAASRMGRWKVLCMLLDRGADVRIEDEEGRTAFALSKAFGQKRCENSLRFCQWNLQKRLTVQERSEEHDLRRDRRMAERRTHLYFDSTLETWRRGPQGQIYMVKLPNPVSVKAVMESESEKPQARPQSRLQPVTDGEKFDFNYGWFDPLRAQQLIPSADDILTYANPSSCSLRPHSILNPEGYRKPLVKLKLPNLPTPSRWVPTTVNFQNEED